jgi:propanol-preferring alcohol dehydrogenase
MLAALYKEKGKPFIVEDVEVPKIGPDEVLVEVKAAGICGTDVHYRRGEFEPAHIPLILGHEGAGIIKEVGENVENLKLNDHVIIHYVISCGVCKNCLKGYDNRCRNRKSIGHDVNGTFAQYIKIPSKNAVKIANSVPLEWGAVIGCAVSTAYHAIRVSELEPGDTIIVFGAGGVGLHAIMWAKFFGAGKVIAVDLINSKLENALNYGADIILNPLKDDILETVRKETGGWGVDIAIECSGSPQAMVQAIKAIKGSNLFESGTIISVGLQPKPFQIEYWGLREGWVTVSGDHTLSELHQIVKLVESGRINLSKSITHRIPLVEINEGIDLIEGSKEHVERVVINKFTK